MDKKDKIETIKTNFQKHIHEGVGIHHELLHPSRDSELALLRTPAFFELHTQDHLNFAKQELENKTTVSLLNCVTHLKRALECQLDTFLYAFDLLDLFRERNLSFPKKMDFIASLGFVQSPSLIRFNTIRNRLEHHYEIPKIDDIEVYFDLVVMFISLLENACHHYSKLELVIGDGTDKEDIFYFLELKSGIISVTPFNFDIMDVDETIYISLATTNQREYYSFFLKHMLQIFWNSWYR